MKTIMLKAVADYQCPGCMKGSSPTDCENLVLTLSGCSAQVAGTLQPGVGVFSLGLPKGFNRFGKQDDRKIEVFESYSALVQAFPHFTGIFTLPIWKHLDDKGNTIVRWFSPRTNRGWTNVILGDCREELKFAMEITKKQIDEEID